ncbi:MAG TPA: tetraacyldisaccharide 4'-kinase [Bacteroidota bacterium]|nr:tetraacyldisaccharide 4'-kinase [Bacteroidota bacterium]
MKPVPALFPLSWLYGGGVALRNLLYDWKVLPAEKINAPVISIGNITAGGTGKTPVVSLLVNRLVGKNVRCAIVSRGYKRKTRGLVEVSDGLSVKTNAANAGDEAFQLATRMPKAVIVVDENRVNGARYAVDRLHAQAVVLDDGFQHRSLDRDLDVVLIDAGHPPFSMAMLPAGYRRDVLSSLKRADAVLLTKIRPGMDIEGLKKEVRRYSDAKIFSSSLTTTSFKRAKTGFSVDLNSIKGKHAVAFCGIGQPESFRESLEELGIIVRSMRTFEDHHPYSQLDLQHVAAEQEKINAEYVVTTEKDLARLSSIEISEHVPLFYLEVEMAVHEEQEWNALIDSVLSTRHE